MSKKLGFILLVSALLLFTGFVFGLMIGKNINDTEIIISNSQDQGFVDYYDVTTDIEILNNDLIDINTASVYELTELPGIGEVIAQRIVDYREENGNFTCIEDLMNVNGIGENRIQAICEYITVGG